MYETHNLIYEYNGHGQLRIWEKYNRWYLVATIIYSIITML